MPSDLLNKILDIYDSGKIIPKHLRQSNKTADSEHETDKIVVPSSSSSSSSVIPPEGLVVSSNKPGSDSIYEDIDDKYDPLATSSLSSSTNAPFVRRKIKKRKKEPENVAVIFSDDDDNEDEMYEETDEAEEPTTAKESSSSSLKGLFHNIRHSAIQLPSSSASSSSVFDGNIFKVPNLPSSFQKEGALKTKEKGKVKTDLLSHYGVDHSSTSFSLSSSSSSGKEGKQVINRDVFSSTIDNVVSADDLLNKKVGDVFGLKGEYEEFMEGGDVAVSILSYLIFFIKLGFHVFVIFWF
jgi:hypothetical protein